MAAAQLWLGQAAPRMLDAHVMQARYCLAVTKIAVNAMILSETS